MLDPKIVWVRNLLAAHPAIPREATIVNIDVLSADVVNGKATLLVDFDDHVTMRLDIDLHPTDPADEES